jgi:hypothetical protein
VQNASPNSALRSIAYGGGRYLVCGYDYSGANIVLTSTNGLDWQDVTASVPAATALGGVAFLDGSFWVTGDNGTILQSDSVDALPRLTGGLLPGDRGFRLQITLNAPPSHRIQTCTDPQFNTWLEVACVTNCRSPYTWIDTNVTRAPIRLYRIVSP